MTPARILRWSSGAVGVTLIVLNSLHLSVGLLRVRAALEQAAIAPRFGEPLTIAWVYIGCINIALGILLLWLGPDLAAGSAAAWKAGLILGVALVAVGLASYLATGKHPGLLFFSLLGLVLLVPLVTFRQHFRR